MSSAFVPSFFTSSLSSSSSGFLLNQELSPIGKIRCGAGKSYRKDISKAVVTAQHTLNGLEIPNPLQCVSNHVLVELEKPKEKTSSGIILATATESKPNTGKVLSVGPGDYFLNGTLHPMAVRVGDAVIFAKYGGEDVEYDGKKCLFMTQDEIVCRLEGGKYAAEAVNPLWDRVLVKRVKSADRTQSGIILTAAKELPNAGEVVAVGPGRFLENGQYEPIGIKVGQSVVYGKFGATELEFDKTDYVIVKRSEVFAAY